ncbi:MAG: glycosyltransferase [Chloroflexi bacterium]|nr:glycosyltransferase [Chloroflexota bacterium]
MRVALYYPWLYLKSGVERTLLELVSRSRHEWTFITNHFHREQTFPELANYNVVELAPVSVKRSFFHSGKAAFRLLTQRLPLDSFDALFISSEGLGDLVTFRNHQIPVYCYCHTPLRPAFDESYRENYLKNKPHHRLPLWLFMQLFTQVDRLAWRHYRRVFCNSAETRRRILKNRLTTADRVEILHPGVDVSRMQPTWEYEPYFLLPGRIMWTKNHELGIRAFRELRERLAAERGRDFRLVIAGAVDAKSQPYIARLRELAGGDPAIRFVADPTDAQLFELYRRCYATLFTAFNEDWGIVPLEAMAYGKPVVATARGGPLESIIDGQTGFLREPESRAFAAALRQLVESPELTRRMGEAGHEHVKRYDWSAFVGRIDDELDTLRPARASLHLAA